MTIRRLLTLIHIIQVSAMACFGGNGDGILSGTIITADGESAQGVNVALKGTSTVCQADEKGFYQIIAPEGEYTIQFAFAGYETSERPVAVKAGKNIRLNVKMKPSTLLADVVVIGNKLDKVRNSAYNATAVDTRELQNTSRTLGDVIARAPGMKIRESGGVGSDMAVTMDGFSGKHVKVFIDGVPQEGVGSSFGLNNIPVNFADRVEVYRGVVPVGFGADALGGIINIVTPKRRRRWFVDASYSYGSFNTHKSYINFGQTLSAGLKYEINVFQNYSDNDYKVDSPVEDFVTGAINRKKTEHVRRFNDTYHNEAIVAKAGVVDRSWADRLMFGLTYSHMYKEIQTGVRQEIVYGQKHRHGYSLLPSLEYSKRNLWVDGFDIVLNANYNYNETVNVDTASVKYNWRGETAKLNSPGEQTYQNQRANNSNWSVAITANYRLSESHVLTFNDIFNSFYRSNENLLTNIKSNDEFTKVTSKNIVGFSYRYTPVRQLNFVAFGKYYRQYVAGPIAVSSAQDKYARTSRTIGSFGYGFAGNWFFLNGFQFKASYEKACRLPTVEEMFGDEDLEVGDIAIRPEISHNANVNFCYNANYGNNALFVELGLIYRHTRLYTA